MLPDVVGARDVLVRDASGELDLPPEALEHLCRRDLAAQDLQRDDLVELPIAGAIDGAHRACAEHPKNVVAPCEDVRSLEWVGRRGADQERVG